MTNEKDREEAIKVLFYSSDLGRDLEVESINLKTNTFIVRPDGTAMVLDGANKLFDRIRSEAVQTKEAEIAAILLDPAAVYANYLRGTINASEIIKAEVTHMVAEAVKAERERCEAIVTEEILEYDCDFTGLVNNIVSRILSDDQEANRG